MNLSSSKSLMVKNPAQIANNKYIMVRVSLSLSRSENLCTFYHWHAKRISTKNNFRGTYTKTRLPEER
jgi:hypothetical protein